MKKYKVTNCEIKELELSYADMIHQCDVDGIGVLDSYDKETDTYIYKVSGKTYLLDHELKKVFLLQYKGYGYHGGGRPKKGDDAKRKTISISGTPAEVQQLQELAAKEGKTVSRFVIDSLIK